MYTKDKTQRITLRLNDEQFCFVKMTADLLGVSPSDFLRMVVNVYMSKEGLRRENEKTNNNNII